MTVYTKILTPPTLAQANGVLVFLTDLPKKVEKAIDETEKDKRLETCKLKDFNAGLPALEVIHITPVRGDLDALLKPLPPRRMRQQKKKG